MHEIAFIADSVEDSAGFYCALTSSRSFRYGIEGSGVGGDMSGKDRERRKKRNHIPLNITTTYSKLYFTRKKTQENFSQENCQPDTLRF